MNQLEELYLKMIDYYAGDPKRLQHFVKVHSFARLIGLQEGLDPHTQFILEATAYVHDIGIKPAEELYGRCDGKLQEKMGPSVAKKMLEELHFDSKDIERICYLIAHHHTYTDIKGLDYQILVEADFLVNLYEDHCSKEAISAACKKIFVTPSGTHLCKTMYHLK